MNQLLELASKLSNVKDSTELKWILLGDCVKVFGSVCDEIGKKMPQGQRSPWLSVDIGYCKDTYSDFPFIIFSGARSFKFCLLKVPGSPESFSSTKMDCYTEISESSFFQNWKITTGKYSMSLEDLFSNDVIGSLQQFFSNGDTTTLSEWKKI